VIGGITRGGGLYIRKMEPARSQRGTRYNGLQTEQVTSREKSSLEPEPGYRLLLPYSDYRSPEA
jgi:hypothetical protein